MKVTDELFRSGVVPKEVDNRKGQSFDTVFKMLKNKYEYFDDMEGSEVIDEHLDALLIEISLLKEKLEHDRESMQQLNNSGGKTSTTTTPTKPPNTQNLLATIAERYAAIAAHIDNNEELRREVITLREALEKMIERG